MSGGNRYRLWLAGGALAAVVLLATGWLALIGPQYAQTSSLVNQNGTAAVQVASLQHRLADLRAQNGKLPQYEADLAKDRAALPSAAALSDFLRELQSAAEASGVAITPATFGAPSAVTGVAQMFVIGTNLTATGTMTQVQRFLNEIQQVQPRAVLITNIDVSSNDTTLNGQVVLSAVMQIFVSTTPLQSVTPSASASASSR